MASQIRGLQKRLSGHAREGLNTRGRRKGPAQLQRKPFMPGVKPIVLVGPREAVDAYRRADARCYSCKGEGVVPSVYVYAEQSIPVLCRCVFQGGMK